MAGKRKTNQRQLKKLLKEQRMKPGKSKGTESTYAVKGGEIKYSSEYQDFKRAAVNHDFKALNRAREAHNKRFKP